VTAPFFFIHEVTQMITTIFIVMAAIWVGLIIDNRTVLEATGTLAYVIFGLIGFYHALIVLIMNIEGHSSGEKFIPTLLTIFFFAIGIATMLMMRGIV